MMCQNCGKREAVTHIKRVINGETSESHLCSECASSLGYVDVFSELGFGFKDLLGGIFSETGSSQNQLAIAERCKKCGNSWHDIVRDGKVGCADCYRTFYDKLVPTLQRIHGRTHHNGKVSKAVTDENVKTPEQIKKEKIENLKKQLDEAVAVQNFELAAKLRDEIKELG